MPPMHCVFALFKYAVTFIVSVWMPCQDFSLSAKHMAPVTSVCLYAQNTHQTSEGLVVLVSMRLSQPSRQKV